MDTEKALHGHISFGILGDDLKAEFQGVFRLEWGQLHGVEMKKNARPY
jgi:hypothetical protein